MDEVIEKIERPREERRGVKPLPSPNFLRFVTFTAFPLLIQIAATAGSIVVLV